MRRLEQLFVPTIAAFVLATLAVPSLGTADPTASETSPVEVHVKEVRPYQPGDLVWMTSPPVIQLGSAALPRAAASACRRAATSAQASTRPLRQRTRTTGHGAAPPQGSRSTGTSSAATTPTQTAATQAVAAGARASERTCTTGRCRIRVPRPRRGTSAGTSSKPSLSCGRGTMPRPHSSKLGRLLGVYRSIGRAASRPAVTFAVLRRLPSWTNERNVRRVIVHSVRNREGGLWT